VQPLTFPPVVSATAMARLAPSARAGESLLFVNRRGPTGTDFDTRADLVVIDRGNNAECEVRRIGELHQMTISPGAAETYPAGAFLEGVRLVDGTALTLLVASAAGANTITISDVSTLRAEQTLLVGPAAGPLETVIIQSIDTTTSVVTLTANLAAGKAIGDLVIPVRALTAAAMAGASFLALNSRIGLQVGDILRIGTPTNEEYAIITGLPNRAPAGVGPDAGNVTLAGPLVRSYPIANTPVVRQNPPVMADVQP